jgi:hypothetical protein
MPHLGVRSRERGRTQECMVFRCCYASIALRVQHCKTHLFCALCCTQCGPCMTPACDMPLTFLHAYFADQSQIRPPAHDITHTAWPSKLISCAQAGVSLSTAGGMTGDKIR